MPPATCAVMPRGAFGRLFMKQLLFLAMLVSGLALASVAGASTGQANVRPEFLVKAEQFRQVEAAQGITSTGGRLVFRAKHDPFLPVASVIFLLAIIHTFVAIPITRAAHRVQHEHDERIKREAVAAGVPAAADKMVSFKATVLHFLGEVEAVFGIWAVVLMLAMLCFHGLDAVQGYLTAGVVFTEPLFVVVIMALASTRPIVVFAEAGLRCVASAGGGTPAAW